MLPWFYVGSMSRSVISEDGFQGELRLAAAVGSRADKDAWRGSRAPILVEEEGIGLWEGSIVHMVEDVEELSTELKIEGLRDARNFGVLDQRGVEVDQPGTDDRVASSRPKMREPCHRIEGRERKASGVDVAAVKGSDVVIDWIAGTAWAAKPVGKVESVITVKIESVASVELACSSSYLSYSKK